MEVLPFSKPISVGYPNLITFGTDRCWRSRIDVLDVKNGVGADRLDQAALGLDRSGSVTAEGHRALLDVVARRARRSGATYCIV